MIIDNAQLSNVLTQRNSTDFFNQLRNSEGLSPSKVWFTSDTHFFHDNVIEYSQRPFASVEEMNETMIANWNKVVHSDDIVFHLGDFCFGDAKEWNYILDSLKGRIVLILGNHDMRNIGRDFMDRFIYVTQQMSIRIAGQKIYLNHFPYLCFSGENYGAWQLFGHIHTNPYNHNVIDEQRLSVLQPTQYDVGVDNNNFTPVSFTKVREIILSNNDGPAIHPTTD